MTRISPDVDAPTAPHSKKALYALRIASRPRVLTLNAGSSSLKWALYEGPERMAAGAIERVGADVAYHRAALGRVLDAPGAPDLSRVDGVGHRVVHGGPHHDRAARVTAALLADLRPLVDLDPDHMPAELAIIDEVRHRAPDLPQVACFDTAFFIDLPHIARLLPIPRRYFDDGVRRYGFHGLSYTYLMDALGRIDQAASRGRVILAHLGSGASMSAVRDGRCMETTMGYTPSSGLVMGTRTGDLDPGVLLHLMRGGLSVDGLDELVNHQSGLLGVSGSSADMRDLLAVEAHDRPAADAVGLFCYQATMAIGALAATIGGIDTLVFAGGIGENAPEVRGRIAARLAHLGVEMDSVRNQAGLAVISTDESRTVVRVIHTNEESVIARQTIAVLTDGDPT